MFICPSAGPSRETQTERRGTKAEGHMEFGAREGSYKKGGCVKPTIASRVVMSFSIFIASQRRLSVVAGCETR